MRWIIRNAETEDVLEGFSKKDYYPIWVSDNPKKWKWFKKWRDVEEAVSIIQKCGYECYPILLDAEK